MDESAALPLAREILRRRSVLGRDDTLREDNPRSRSIMTAKERHGEEQYILGMVVALTFVLGRAHNMTAAEEYIGRVKEGHRG